MMTPPAHDDSPHAGAQPPCGAAPGPFHRIIKPITFTLVAFIGIAVLSTRACATGGWHDQQGRMGRLQGAAEGYYRQTGSFPVSDAESSWFEKLVAAQYVDPQSHGRRLDAFGIDPETREPLDLYGSPVICELVVSPDGTEQVVIRCTGPNGVDDGGDLDDWDSRYGPNAGYWYKDHWPALYRNAIIYGVLCTIITIILIVLVRRFVRIRLLAAMLLCLTLGILWVTIWPDGDIVPFRVSSTADPPGHDPAWIEAVHSVATLLILAGVIQAFILLIGVTRRPCPPPPNTCACCGYDMRGCPTSICPECGADQSS